MRFSKYHALGNDYLVLDPVQAKDRLSVAQIRLLCDRHYGVGSDGILVGPLESPTCDFSLQFFNPDGSEFEKSGNGLRIFCRYLWDIGLVEADPFTIWTPGGEVTAQVQAGGRSVMVEMGRVSFHSSLIPVDGPPREVINETLEVGGEKLRICAATIGNPHCVVLREEARAEEAQRLGPLIENEARFPNRTNVQFMKVLDRSNIQIEIWERGAGYTLASGSSSCAAAAVARKLELCDAHVAVTMPGGILDIHICEDWSVSMTGPATKVCEGIIFDEIFNVKPGAGPSQAKYEMGGLAHGKDTSRRS